MNRREDLANVEMGELEIIKTFIPKQPTDEELADYVTEVIKDYLSVKDIIPLDFNFINFIWFFHKKLSFCF